MFCNEVVISFTLHQQYLGGRTLNLSKFGLSLKLAEG